MTGPYRVSDDVWPGDARFWLYLDRMIEAKTWWGKAWWGYRSKFHYQRLRRQRRRGRR